MTSLARRQKTLESRLQELNVRLQTIGDELESHQSSDWEELAVERETDEVLEGMGLSGQEEIKAITAALQRIHAGEYGYCVTCGARIAEDRLDIVPYTPFCPVCATRHAGAR